MTSARLDVDACRFVKGIRNIYVDEGSDAEFDIVLEHESETHWERNGDGFGDDTIYHDGVKYIITNTPTTSKLVIKNVNRNDEAAYMCMAGSSRTIGRLYVENIKLQRRLSDAKVFDDNNPNNNNNSNNNNNNNNNSNNNNNNNNSNNNNSNTYGQPQQNNMKVSNAEITKPTKTVEVVENKIATLNFHVNQPGKNACWYKNGIELDLAANSRFTYEVRDLCHSLSIDECKF